MEHTAIATLALWEMSLAGGDDNEEVVVFDASAAPGLIGVVDGSAVRGPFWVARAGVTEDVKEEEEEVVVLAALVLVTTPSAAKLVADGFEGKFSLVQGPPSPES